MRSLPASLTLVVAAILQAMGMYQYSEDSIVVSGQVFFPVLFALMAVYLAWRTRETPRFGVVHAAIMVLGFAALVLTLIGRITTNYALYPSWKIYYASLAVLVLELFFRILGTPKKVRTAEQEQAPARRSRRRRVAGQGPTHLVARPKGSTAKPEAGAEPDAGTEPGAADSADPDVEVAPEANTPAGESRGARG